jgi:hypothetical protein
MRRTRLRLSCTLLTISSGLLLGACTSNLPNVEIDLTLMGTPTVLVAPCHPGEDVATCFTMHQQVGYPPLDGNMLNDNIGIFDVPGNVSDLTLLVQQTDPEVAGQKPCSSIVVHLKHGDEKLALTAGTAFALSCPAGSDCETPVSCAP